MPKTKIVCTLGPASSNKTVLRGMMRAGMDVVRLNFSHGSLSDVSARIRIVRSLNDAYRRRLRLLGDLQGHRIRIGDLAEPIELKKHRMVRVTTRRVTGAGDLIPFDYRGPLRTIGTGCHLFIDDGNLALEVVGRTADELKARVLVGGLLKAHKGVNIPAAKLEFGPMSGKDEQDILFCRQEKVDYIAQSFVRSASDIQDVRRVLGGGSPCRVIAKIENADGIRNIDSIIAASDGIMIARGDMGVSLPIYEIPMMQKMIIGKCNRARKFVITATQMLESMTENLRPTRAEVTDVANAILDGTDMVMLSGETAVGAHPVETVRMMNDIIVYTEKHRHGRHMPGS